jgi:hypothetical protein
VDTLITSCREGNDAQFGESLNVCEGLEYDASRASERRSGVPSIIRVMGDRWRNHLNRQAENNRGASFRRCKYPWEELRKTTLSH